jgi:hypothetical protein
MPRQRSAQSQERRHHERGAVAAAQRLFFEDVPEVNNGPMFHNAIKSGYSCPGCARTIPYQYSPRSIDCGAPEGASQASSRHCRGRPQEPTNGCAGRYEDRLRGAGRDKGAVRRVRTGQEEAHHGYRLRSHGKRQQASSRRLRHFLPTHAHLNAKRKKKPPRGDGTQSPAAAAAPMQQKGS